MRSIAILFGIILWPLGESATADQPEKWRELSNEQKVVATKPFIHRQKNELTIDTIDGKKMKWIDEQSEGSFSLHRVIEVDPKSNWVLLFEPTFEGQSLRMVHRKSGNSEILDGSVVWSKDQRYFATLSEDGGSDRTPNLVSIWSCKNPEDRCLMLWKKGWAGKSVKWTGLEAQFAAEDPESLNPKPKKIHCKIKDERGTEKVLCDQYN